MATGASTVDPSRIGRPVPHEEEVSGPCPPVIPAWMPTSSARTVPNATFRTSGLRSSDSRITLPRRIRPLPSTPLAGPLSSTSSLKLDPRFIGIFGRMIRFPVMAAADSPGGWISSLATPRHSVTVNSCTSRSGKVNISERRMAALLMAANPEFLTRSKTSEGSTTSWPPATIFHAAQLSFPRTCLSTSVTGVSMSSRHMIRRHP
jgi:hypothetical protein